MGLTNLVDDLVPGWTSTAIKGKKFNEIFHIDNVPLWWFYRRFVIEDVLPRHAGGGGIASQLLRIFMRKFFYYNERVKCSLSRPLLPSSSPKILFLTYTTHQHQQGAYRIQKMVDALHTSHQFEPFVVRTIPLSRASYGTLRDASRCDIYSFVDEEVRMKARKISNDLFIQWKDSKPQTIFHNHWPEVRGILTFFFSREFIYNTILYYLACRKQLKIQNVRCLILTSSNGLFDRCLIAAAYTLNIPVIIAQHGNGLGSVDPDMLPGVTFAVFGEKYKQRLQKWIPKSDIVVTGPITFDNLYNYSQQEIPPEKTILLITGPFVECNLLGAGEYFALVRHIAQEISLMGYTLTIKLHPRERHRAEYEKVLGEDVSIIDQQGSDVLYTLIRKSALVITFASTVALEAMLLDRPVLTIDLQRNRVPDYKESIFAGGPVITRNDSLPLAIKDVLAPSWKEKRQRIITEYCYKNDGLAHRRVIALAYTLINRQQPHHL